MDQRRVGFRYQTIMTNHGPVPVVIDDSLEKNQVYYLNLNNMVYREPEPDRRSRPRKFIDDWKQRLSNAWYALRGGEYD